MQNPWLHLPQHSPYVLEIDRESLNLCNNRVASTRNINVHSIPEPFIGNPEMAKIILLNLNPGDSLDDPEAHENPEFRTAIMSNLRHQLTHYPFYPLNPKFAWSPVARLWTKRLGALIRAVRLDSATFAQRLCVIEWFPYHSRKAGRCVCPSQEYSFYLAKEALGKKLIVRMRAKNEWAKVDPGFAETPSLRNPQCAFITRGNTRDGLFNEIVEVFQCGI